MLKEDLIAMLDRLPAGADIRIESPTHDYWRTKLAIDPREVAEVQVKESAYHNGADAITDDHDGEDGDTRTVYVIA
jgi:hypothetical protein